MRSRRRRRSRWWPGLFALAPLTGVASSHREAPLVSGRSRRSTTPTSTRSSARRARHGHPDQLTGSRSRSRPAARTSTRSADDARYDINIDNDGDAKPDIDLPVDVHDHYRNPNTFLYNNGPVTSLDDENLNFYQTYDLTRINGTGNSTKLVNNATGGAVQRRRRVDAELQQRLFDAGRHDVGRHRRQDAAPARPTTRSSSTCACSTCSTGRPVRGRRRHAGRVQRQHVRAAGAEGAARRGPRRRSDPIVGVWSTASRRACGSRASDGRRRSTASTSRSHAWACRW